MLQRMAEPHRGKRNFHNHESDEQFNGNVTAAAAGATVLTLKLNGEAVGGTEMDYTVVTANTYQNVSADTLIPVPAGTSLTVSVGNISTTEVLVKDANLIIKKVA